jgi:hypothetical protein
MPSGKLAKIGVWEFNRFIGVVLFGSGANRNIGHPYHLQRDEVCELVRIALTTHSASVSRILSIACRLIKKQYPKLKAVISYADPEQGHHGGVYQACGWAYVGKSNPQQAVVVAGRIMHKRSASALYGTIKGLQKSHKTWKHTYVLPLNSELASTVKQMIKSYPKRARSTDSDAPSDQLGEGGATPTRALLVTEGEQ